MGFQTPCFSSLTTYLVPQQTTPPDYWLVSDFVFARSFALAPPRRAGLSRGALAAIIVPLVVLLIVLLAALLWWLAVYRRESAKTASDPGETASGSVVPKEEEEEGVDRVEPLHIQRVESQPTEAPVELAAGDVGRTTEPSPPRTPRSVFEALKSPTNKSEGAQCGHSPVVSP